MYAADLRGVLIREQVRAVDPERAEWVRSVDLLPLSGFAAVGPIAGVERARLTAQATRHLADLEGAGYTHSTVDAFTDVPLLYLAPYSGMPVDDAPDPQWAALINDTWRGAHRWVAADGQDAAAWVVDGETGEVHALLRDGSGGGVYAELEQFGDVERALDRTNAAGLVFSAANLAAKAPFGVVIFFAKVIANAYGAAAIVIGSITAALADEVGRDVIVQAACQATKHVAIWPFRAPGDPVRAWAQGLLSELWSIPCAGR